MPAAIAIPLITAAAGAGASIYAANRQSNASRNAYNSQTQTANHSADVQSQAARDALEYQRQESARDQSNYETTQRSNYDQWAASTNNDYAAYVASLKNDRAAAVAGGHNTYNQWSARDKRIGKLGEMIGLGPRDTPGYEEIAPLEVPQYTVPAYNGPKNSAPPDPKLRAAVDAELKRTNSSDDPEYWARQIAAHGDGPARNWAYWQDRFSKGDGVGKGYRGTAASLLG